MALPDDDQLEFDFDELLIDETNEEIEAPEGGEAEGGEAEGIGRQGNADEGGQEGQLLSRKERRVQALANKTREAETRATAAEAQARLLQQQFAAMQAQVQQPQYDPRAEQEYVAALDPIERYQYYNNRQLQGVQQSVQHQQFMMMDMMDKNSYQIQAASNPVYRQLEPEVEKLRMTELAKGRHFSRGDILAFLIGQKMLNKKTQQGKGKGKPKPKSSQVTKPGNASTDVSSGRSSDSERSARAKRMSTYTF